MKEKVLLGMSGGVDSAASAVVLLQMGYDVTGMTMQLHRAEKNDRRCGTPDDREDYTYIYCWASTISPWILPAALKKP